MATQSAPRGPRASVRVATQNGYFFWMSLVLLAIVLIGFTPTLYARPMFTQPEPSLPLYLYLHGLVLTTWYAWMVLQTALVRYGQTATHRRMGWIGAGIAAAVCVVGPWVTIAAVGRLRAAGLDFDTDISALPYLGVEGVTLLEFASPVVWGNLMIVTVFAGLVVAAIVFRKRAQHHKRLMLLASISLIAPALARISRWPVFGGEDGPLIPVGALVLLLSVAAFDLATRRRLHPATNWPTLAILAVLFGSPAIAATDFGYDFVRSLA